MKTIQSLLEQQVAASSTTKGGNSVGDMTIKNANSRQRAPRRRQCYGLSQLSHAAALCILLVHSRPGYAWQCPSSVGKVAFHPRQGRSAYGRLSHFTRQHMAYQDTDPLLGGGGGVPADKPTSIKVNGETADAEEKTQQQQQLQQPLDYTGAGTLGDIMSTNDDTVVEQAKDISFDTSLSRILQEKTNKSSPTKSGLVTQDGGTLAFRFGITFPLDRMALTANGNLQRLFSSYYDVPVHVLVDKCTLRSHENGVWDRVVHLTVHNQTFCTATSEITVHSPNCRSLVESGRVGLGQLFRHLDKLPTFTLLDAGYGPNGGLWRHYKLTCCELVCNIHEEFAPHAWEMEPNKQNP